MKNDITPEYQEAFTECIRDIVSIMRKSPEHGNAMMDILGETRYNNVLFINGGLIDKELFDKMKCRYDTCQKMVDELKRKY